MTPRTRIALRSLSTSSSPFSKKYLDQPPLAQHDTSSSSPVQHAVFIRPWEGISAMSEAFAILRGVEKKYGRIREFRLLWDYENRQSYQSYLWALFRDKPSFNSLPLPPKADIIQVQTPDMRILDLHRHGALGLADLDGLMLPNDKQDEDEREIWGLRKGRIVDVRVERVGKRSNIRHSSFSSQSIPGPTLETREKKLAMGHAFLDWGGFAGVPALGPSPFVRTESTNDESPLHSEETSHDHKHMRLALSKWAHITGKDDPNINGIPSFTGPFNQPHVDVSKPRFNPPQQRPPVLRIQQNIPPPMPAARASENEEREATEMQKLEEGKETERRRIEARALAMESKTGISLESKKRMEKEEKRKEKKKLEKKDEKVGQDVAGVVKRYLGGWL